MAIQQINLGSAPAGTGGDTQRAANTKINQNFSNQAHAASRLVGDGATNIPACQDVKKAFLGIHGVAVLPSQIGLPNENSTVDADELPVGQAQLYQGYFKPSSSPYTIPSGRYLISTIASGDNTRYQVGISTNGDMVVRGRFGLDSGEAVMRIDGVSVPWARLYSTGNTILENGYLKPSSPVLRLRHSEFEKEHEAGQLDINVDNPEKGVYKITGTTGLRKNDGWYFSPPKDEHFNILCMVEIEEEGDIITVKTYAKKFDFEKVAIVPDYENPVDIIGEVLLRFNDLPQEQLDEPIE